MQKKLFLSIIAAAWLIACNITTVARAQKTSKTATVKCGNKVENDDDVSQRERKVSCHGISTQRTGPRHCGLCGRKEWQPKQHQSC